MTGNVFAARSLTTLFVIALLAAGGVRAHGDDNEYRDPGHGMEYEMESEMLGESCPGCGMRGVYDTGPGMMMRGYGMGPEMMRGHGMGPEMMRGYGMGPEMMRGYGMGPEMMHGHGMGPEMMHGHGMGPGMMGGYGTGPEMMHGHGMGPGMMGGYGMSPGMMGGYGMSPGMMGVGPMSGLELSDDQRKRMFRIQSELRKQNLALQSEIIDAREQLFELYLDDTLDAKKIGAAYGKIFDLRRQMIEATIEARNRQRETLTEEQRDQLRKGASGRSGGERGPKSGGMGPQHRGQMMGG